MRFKLLILSLLASVTAYGTTIVPRPVSVVRTKGSFRLSDVAKIRYNTTSIAPLADYLDSYLTPAANADIVCLLSDAEAKKDVVLLLDEALDLPAEGYRLSVTSAGITITGRDYGGIFNGIETLLQLLPADVYARKALDRKTRIAAVEIEDYPRFRYRGMHLDVARTFVAVDGVKRFIDNLAHHKINKLHWHLTDDEGWRIELKSHPELAAVGGFRGGDSPVKSIYGEWGRKYGGYYTQDQIRDIVAYAALRNIEIIPEIDLPGHSRTAALLHPEILCDYDPDLSDTGGYDRRSAWCASKESNYELLSEIIGEVCGLFPSKYFHVGGDEVVMEQWLSCPHCTALLKELGSDDPHRIEDYFMSRLEKILYDNGKIPAVWNEAINGGTLSKTSRVYGWENVKACLKATSEGFQTIVMPGAYFYFDMRQSPDEPGHNWAGIFDADKCYSFDFAKAGFTEENMKNVAGVQGAFWSEAFVSNGAFTTDFLEYQTYPRICALSEICWTPDALRDSADFKARIDGDHRNRMAAMNIHFRMLPPTVDYADGVITAMPPSAGAEIRYTSDGRSEPTIDSPLYTVPVEASRAEAMRYRFRAFYATGSSRSVSAMPEADSTVRPAFRLLTSFEQNPKSGFEQVESYKTFCRTTRTSFSGDWIMYLFEQPVECRSMNLTVGFRILPAYLFVTGYAEVSYDGRTFVRAGDLHDGSITIYPEPEQSIYAVRLVCTENTNGYGSDFINAPIVKPRE